jgi:hypothetical protein
MNLIEANLVTHTDGHITYIASCTEHQMSQNRDLSWSEWDLDFMLDLQSSNIETFEVACPLCKHGKQLNIDWRS